MPDPDTYNQESFVVTSGGSGSFSFLAAPSAFSTPAFSSGPGALSGTFNGQEITGFSTYHNPLNAVENPVYMGNGDYTNANITGIIAPAANANDPAYQNGISFTLKDGTDVHIYLHDIDGYHHFELLYETSSGDSGPISLQYSEITAGAPPCFVRGTLICTVSGNVQVDGLRVGDLVLTYAGEAKRVRWIGQTVVHPSRLASRREADPIRVRAGAIASNLPATDLMVSPGHALLIGDMLINAADLVNGGTIMQEMAELVHYYHVELDSHEILVANGMPCESYLDDGNRRTFLNGADHVRLHGRLDRVSPNTCHPLIDDGPLLTEARAGLLARALELGWRVEKRPALTIEASGSVLNPAAQAGDRYWFVLPAGSAGPLRLCSTAAIVNRIYPTLADTRLLGVAVGELRVDGRDIDLGARCFGPGFQPLETDGHAHWRWTNGSATLALDAPATMIELRLQIVMPALHQGADAERTARVG